MKTDFVISIFELNKTY